MSGPRDEKGKAHNQRTRTTMLGAGAEKLPTLTTGSLTQKAYTMPNALCPECGAEARTKKATEDESGKNGVVPGIKKGDHIFSRHRVGGGTYSMMRGDLLCKGTGLPVQEEVNNGRDEVG